MSDDQVKLTQIELTDEDINRVSGGWVCAAVSAGIFLISAGWEFGKALAEN